MSGALVFGRQVRILNVMNDSNREGLDVKPDFSMPAERVIEIMEQIITRRGKPQGIRVDNGSEYCLTFSLVGAKRTISVSSISNPANLCGMLYRAAQLVIPGRYPGCLFAFEALEDSRFAFRLL